MIDNDMIFNKIAEALLIDYTSVYYVNAVTNEYQWYSADSEFHSLNIQQHGNDFFKNLIDDADKVIYEEDKHIFMEDMQKEKLLAQMKKGTMQSIVYRLMIDGKPVYHTLRLIRGTSENDDYFILGVLNIDEEWRMKKERETFDQIAESLAEHYDTLYYIDIETNNYFEYSSTDIYKSLNIPNTGNDFFAESSKNIKKIVHPDDKEKVLKMYHKKDMLRHLRNKKMFSASYRLIISDRIVHIRCSQIWARDKKHIIVCLENIDAEVQAKEVLEETRRKSITYAQIAESLASHYDVIYYVDISSGEYTEFTAKSIYGSLEVREDGKDFFADSQRNSRDLVYPEDMDRVLTVLGKDYLITALEDKKQYSTDYRLLIDGKPQYTRLTVMWSSDRVHFIIGVQNVDEEVRKQKEQVQALNIANELARRDELTGTKNKNAYHELESSVQQDIDSRKECAPFAIVVCDINGLKHINDTHGHKAGDEYIRAACKVICQIFAHSPVFRIGGDEFVIFMRGSDYNDRGILLNKLRGIVMENIRLKSGPVVAAGISEFDMKNDKLVTEVFERADAKMYEEKKLLKEKQTLIDTYSENTNDFISIPKDRKLYLDSLFEAFSVVAEGTYVYICDMKYDYSRWSKNAVDTFGLPSEYMYGAGGIWEEHIHPEDREAYRSGIAEVFSGDSSGHDMQYRARRFDGKYDLCTCKGVVLKNLNGEADYFGGAIRNNSIHGGIDTLTGLMNQYEFFEDINNHISNKSSISICMIGISKFSEINEIYGYHFGNSVLQKFGRYMFEHVGNQGSAYRIDGTKFAVISTSRTTEEMKSNYSDLRNHYREGLNINGRHIMLELNAGLITLNNFEIDCQTVYTCLNFAYGESKVRKHGDIVEFYNNLNDENKYRIEMLHKIRASITQKYKGFYLLYQPVVDARTEKLIGAEALLRWGSDEYGTVAPDTFIPLLEKDPLFPDLGEWILRTALSDAKNFLKFTPDFMINVNLSYTQLEKHDFADMVLSVINETNYPPEHLCLEITERCRLLDIGLLKNVVTRLRDMKIKVALDDFGTGFSSIGIVKELPFDIIKIDRSFVKRIEEDEKERELIKSFAGIASTFDARVCVEGIENAEMINILRGYSVHSFQGYYYAKPIAFDEFKAWHESRNI